MTRIDCLLERLAWTGLLGTVLVAALLFAGQWAWLDICINFLVVFVTASVLVALLRTPGAPP